MISLVYCGNDRVFKGLLMSLYSAQTTTKEALDVHVLTGDFTALDPRFKPFSEKQRAFLEGKIRLINPKSKITLHDIAASFNEAFAHSPNLHNSYTPYAMLRLFMDKIPGLPEKVLYLDVDTIVLKDLSKLYSVDVTDKDFAGVLDAYGRYLINPLYVNTGVLLMNLKKMKSDNVFARCIDLLAHHHYFFPDQAVLNKVCRKGKLYLPRDYNEQKKLHSSTLIRHYCNQPRIFPYVHAMIAKPWDIERIHQVYKTSIHDKLYRETSAIWEEFEHV